ncbi:MAG: hypothetical protein ACREDZ_00735 [Kiloniellales bacterium]
MPRFEGVIAAADDALSRLRTLERRLNAEIRFIKLTAREQPLSLPERKSIADLRAEKAAVADAIEELGLVTLERLDRHEEVQRLVNVLDAAHLDLDERRDHIERFARDAEDYSTALNNIQVVSQELKGILPKQ